MYIQLVIHNILLYRRYLFECYIYNDNYIHGLFINSTVTTSERVWPICIFLFSRIYVQQNTAL